MQLDLLGPLILTFVSSLEALQQVGSPSQGMFNNVGDTF